MPDLVKRNIRDIWKKAILESHHVLREGEIYGPWAGRGREIGCVNGEGLVPGLAVHAEQRWGWSIGVPDFNDARGGMGEDVLGTCDGSRN